MKLYAKLVEKLAVLAEKMMKQSLNSLRVLFVVVTLSISLSKWGRIAIRISFFVTIIISELSIVSAISYQYYSTKFLTPEQSGILMRAALLLLTTTIILRSLACLIFNAADKASERVKINE